MALKTQNISISVKEVAEFAGVHRTTASKVLNNDVEFKISEATRKRILKAAQRLGFKRNDRFSTPRGVRSFGLFTYLRYNKQDNPFYSDVFDGIDAEARDQKLNIYLINNLEQLNLIHLLEQPDFLGAIVIGEGSQGLLAPFEMTQKPLVAVEGPHHLDSSILYAVRTDQYRGMFDATEYLIQAGHRNIYYLSFMCGGKEMPGSMERYEGVAMALRKAGLYTGTHRVLAEMSGGVSEDPAAVKVGYQAMLELLAQNPPRPYACVCYSDLHAEGAYQAAKDHGLKIPEEVSFFGYDDIPRSAQMVPPLSTVDTPRYELGRQAVRTLMDIEAGKGNREEILPHHLVIRESVSSLK